MNRPVLPPEYAAKTWPLRSIKTWTAGLDPTPTAHTVDVHTSDDGAPRRTSPLEPGSQTSGESAAKITTLASVGLGAGDATSCGVATGVRGATRTRKRTSATAAVAAESTATCRRLDGSDVAPSG